MMDNNPNNFWLIRTHQAWKFFVFLAAIFLGITSFLAMIMVINDVQVLKGVGELELALISIFLGFGSLIWLSQSIRCPECGYKPAWSIIKSAPAGEWLGKISKLEHCPSCKK